MDIHPDIRALRGDDAPQRAAQQIAHDAMAAWQEEPAVARLLGEIAAFGTTHAMAECPALAALFEEGSPSAGQLATSFVRAGCGILREHRLAHLPQRHSAGNGTSVLVLARSAHVLLTLSAVDGETFAKGPRAKNAEFWPGETWERVLAGSASAELVERRVLQNGDAGLVTRRIALDPGKVVCRDAERQAMILREVTGCFVTLRLQRRRVMAGPAQEVALDSGAMVHQSAGNPRDSRIEMMMALLGRMGRRDAAPLITAIAREPGSESLRWQALREGLALDTATGFAALCGVAADSADPLAVPAGSLRAQLLETYPQLASIVPCPA